MGGDYKALKRSRQEIWIDNVRCRLSYPKSEARKTITIVADTNVLIAATFWQGASNAIIEKVGRNELALAISEEIIEEFTRVLQYPHIRQKVNSEKLEMKRSVEKLVSLCSLTQPTVKIDILKKDPDDNRLLECALAINADYLLSYDKHLLALKEFREIKIITPEEFLRRMFE